MEKSLNFDTHCSGTNERIKVVIDEFGNVFGMDKCLLVSDKVNNLYKMRKFYVLIEKLATLSPNLSYSHYVELLPMDNLNKVHIG